MYRISTVFAVLLHISFLYMTHLTNIRLTFPVYFLFMYSLSLISNALFFCLSKPREFLQINLYIPSLCRIIILWLSVLYGTAFCWLFYLHLFLCSPYALFCMFTEWRNVFNRSVMTSSRQRISSTQAQGKKKILEKEYKLKNKCGKFFVCLTQYKTSK